MKPINTNELRVSPQDTVAIFSLLAKVAFERTSLTDEDATAARALLSKAANTYPHYAEVSQTNRNDTKTVRPALSPTRQTKKRR